MEERLRVLERIAALALEVRSLERELVNNKDPRLVMDRLKMARLELDKALGNLERLERG